MKSKRCVIWLLLICLMLLPGTVQAELAQLAPRVYEAGIPSEQFQYYAAPEGEGRQRMANWCWAASIQMVLNYHGLYVSQEDIVQKVYGQLVDTPAGPDQIIYALNGWVPDSSGRYAAVAASPYYINGPSIVQDLAYRWPLIVGLKGNPTGHAYVLTAVVYTVDSWNNPIFQKVILRDPWPGNPSRQEWSWQDFQSRLMFITRVHVARQQ